MFDKPTSHFSHFEMTCGMRKSCSCRFVVNELILPFSYFDYIGMLSLSQTKHASGTHNFNSEFEFIHISIYEQNHDYSTQMFLFQTVYNYYNFCRKEKHPAITVKLLSLCKKL